MNNLLRPHHPYDDILEVVKGCGAYTRLSYSVSLCYVYWLIYSTSKTWSLWPGQSLMALPVHVRALLEYWSIGVLVKRKLTFDLNWSFHYSITPPLHHSRRLPQVGKSMEAPSGGSPKPGPLGPDSLLLVWLDVELQF